MADGVVRNGGQMVWDPIQRRFVSQPVAKPDEGPLATQYKGYTSAVEQNAEDYSGIMAGYKDIIARAKSTPRLNLGSSYSPQDFTYNTSADHTNSINNLRGLSENGGYDETAQQNLRARAIGPIRSIYAGANREIDRNRALSGGYSPNYNAAKAKMAREMSEETANAMIGVNAGIADKVAQGRLSIAPSLASATGQESALRNQYGRANVDTRNDAQKFNMTLPLEYGKHNMMLDDATLRALQGMQGLYGTSPAWTATMGGQALSAAQLQAMLDQQGRASGNSLLGTVTGAFK